MLRVDIGSGHSRVKGYVRVDGDPSTNPDVICMADNLTFKDGEVDEVVASHILEHFYPEDTFGVLIEWKRVLKPGGKITIRVPNVGKAMKLWSEGAIGDCCLMKSVFGSDPRANEFMAHKNIFWESKLERFLFITGFVEIKNKTKPTGLEIEFEANKP